MRIFIVSPANVATGGVELLHQFAKSLTDNGIETYMLHPEADHVKCPVPDVYWKYGIRYVSQYVDSSDSVLVLPETRIHYIKLCTKGYTMVWWLSVDNYIRSYKGWMKDGNFDVFNLKERKNVLHFVQSYYAKVFLEKHLNINGGYVLKDYINEEITEFAVLHRTSCKRENICLYNPLKGYEKLEPVIKACRKDITWIPLSGYRPVEMAELMCRAKVYVDFGSHPGKDRIPREAAVCGCCILTNREGSAAYKEDVGIPESYKIEKTENISYILEKLYNLIDCYEERTEEYSDYRQVIEGEKEEFEEEVRDAIAVLKERVETSEGVNSLSEDVLIFEKTLDSIELAIAQIQQLLSEARRECREGRGGKMRDKLLTVDYILQMIREVVYGSM